MVLVSVNASENAVRAEQFLGLKMRFENFTEAHENLIAVQEVIENSPASEAGLKAYKEFIMGTP